VTESFFRRLERRATEADSLLCVGLDPHGVSIAGARAACRAIVAATAGYAAAFKPNAAFFEALGPEGTPLLAEVIRGIPERTPVVLDAKRGDIATSAEAYAAAAFDVLGADAVTVSPYLGREALAPFLDRADRGIFVLARTSNPGAADLQDAPLATGEPLAERVVALFAATGAGFVVGATAPEALRAARRLAPGSWLLAPGVGTQGGDLASAVRAGIREDGLGLLVPASRAIGEASDPAAAARRLRDRINEARRAGPTPAPDDLDRLAIALHASGCIRFGEFTLKSGAVSPVYVDLRRLAGHPGLLAGVARRLAGLLAHLEFDHIAALPYAALPIGAAVALQTGRSLVYPRRETKAYGTGASVEGVFESGDRAVVLDDLATTGGSKLEAIERLEAAGLEITDVAVLIDREGGAGGTLREAGIRFHAVITLTDLAERLAACGRIDPATHRVVVDYLRA
jgi:uridine monophosphate synthetase